MKTDRFADIIRRKLDSIRPEYSERDWARMQATLKQAGPNPNTPTPSAHPFASQAARFAAAGAVGTAIFLTTTIWQHYEIKRLHQTIQTVSQKANSPELNAPDVASATPSNTETGAVAATSAPAQSKESVQGNTAPATREQNETHPITSGNTQRDTVYIDRYVTVPAPASRLRAADSPQSASQPERRVMGNRTAQSDYSTPSTRPGNPASTQNQSTRQADNQTTEPALGTTQQHNDGIHPEKLAQGAATTRSGRNRDRISGNYPDAETNGKSFSKGVYRTESTGQTTTSGGSTGNVVTPADNQSVQPQPGELTGNFTSGSGNALQPALAYETLTALPMQTNTVHWNVLLAQRAKRMRPARTTVVSGPATVAAEPAVQRVQAIPFRFRVGVGADVSSPVWSYGAYTEAVLLKHWSLSLGVSKATFATNTFPNPLAFDRQNPQDFRRQYARALDPRFEIFNIQTYTTRIQMPVSLGYRIALSQSFTLLPTIGTNLNLQSQQYISFFHELPYRLGYEKIDGLKTQPIDLINNMTFGASVEWQTRHWAAQAGPLVTTPLQSDPGCLQNATVGLRARVLYQF